MLLACASSFGALGPHGWSWLHGLAAFSVVAVLRGTYQARRGHVRPHRTAMVLTYLGALIAGAFAVAMPNRLLGRLLRSSLDLLSGLL